MRLHSIIRNLCLGSSVASLALVYGLSMYWPVLIALPAMLFFRLLTKSRSSFWRDSALLCVYLGLSVTAVLLNRPLVPLELGCLAALIWWDLQDFESTRSTQTPAEASSSIQKYRLQSLSLTAAAGLLLAGTGLWLHIQLPFGAIVMLILLITACLVYAVGILRNAPASRE